MRGVNPPSVQSAATSRTDLVLFLFFYPHMPQEMEKAFLYSSSENPSSRHSRQACCDTSPVTLNAPQIFPREMSNDWRPFGFPSY